jgi:uncharacterized damage-inducible protein DinB
MRLFRRGHERFWRAVGPLTAAQIGWRPRADADSIGQILDHVILAENVLICLIAGESLPAGPAGVPAHRAGRSGEARSGLDAGRYLAELAVQYERGMACLARLTDSRLREALVRPWDGHETTIEGEIEHLIDHLAYHRGQIIYLTMMESFPE